MVDILSDPLERQPETVAISALASEPEAQMALLSIYNEAIAGDLYTAPLDTPANGTTDLLQERLERLDGALQFKALVDEVLDFSEYMQLPNAETQAVMGRVNENRQPTGVTPEVMAVVGKMQQVYDRCLAEGAQFSPLEKEALKYLLALNYRRAKLPMTAKNMVHYLEPALDREMTNLTLVLTSILSKFNAQLRRDRRTRV